MPRLSSALGSVLSVFLILLLLLSAGCAGAPDARLRDTDHPLSGRLWDVAARRFIDEAELIERATHAQVLLLGETHDNSEHHRLQGRVLRARLAAGARPALLMEQFDTDQQALIDQARQADLSLAPLMRGWDWPQYQPLVAMANAARIPLRAANLSRSAIRPIVRDGYAALAPGEAQRLALESAWDAERQAYMVRLIDASHCGQVSAALRDGLVRAQRLRDATLADTALGQLEHGVVFILGRGHARRDVAVPRYLQTRRPGTRVLSLAFVEVSAPQIDPSRYEQEQVGDLAPFDLLWFTPRAERADPCLNFGK